MNNILKEIEAKYPVDTILVNGEQVWPYLRLAYFFAYRAKAASEKGEKVPEKSFSRRLIKVLKNSLYGLKSWFGKYDYVVLSDTTERKEISGKYFNKLLDPIIDELGRDKVLYIESPAPSLYPIKRVHTKNVVCHDLLTLLAAIRAMLIPKSCVIQNGFILKTIQKEYGLDIADVQTIRRFAAQRRVFDLLFRKFKPKAILLSDHGSHFPAIKAAKDLGIKVIEFQHGGIIDKYHPTFNVGVEIDKSCFPDYFLVFGRRELRTFDNSQFIEPANVYPVGSFYIEYVRQNHKPEPNLVRRLANYKRTIGLTLEWTTEKHAIEFICQAANLDDTILYILIPRRPMDPARPQEEYYSTLELPDNVVVIQDKNFYEFMMYVDFHSTVHSTCALEAPSLGVQNILINIDGLSKQLCETVLNDSRVTRYADTPTEFVNMVNTFEKLDRDTISKLNEDIIATNYKENLRSFVRRHLTL